MEQKKSKVTSVVQGQDWVGKQGVFHTWTVRFENGDVGGNMTKQGNNCAFKVGETVDYTIEPAGQLQGEDRPGGTFILQWWRWGWERKG